MKVLIICNFNLINKRSTFLTCICHLCIFWYGAHTMLMVENARQYLKLIYDEVTNFFLGKPCLWRYSEYTASM